MVLLRGTLRSLLPLCIRALYPRFAVCPLRAFHLAPPPPDPRVLPRNSRPGSLVAHPIASARSCPCPPAPFVPHFLASATLAYLGPRFAPPPAAPLPPPRPARPPRSPPLPPAAPVALAPLPVAHVPAPDAPARCPALPRPLPRCPAGPARCPPHCPLPTSRRPMLPLAVPPRPAHCPRRSRPAACCPRPDASCSRRLPRPAPPAALLLPPAPRPPLLPLATLHSCSVYCPASHLPAPFRLLLLLAPVRHSCGFTCARCLILLVLDDFIYRSAVNI
ncbi:hypothetical protein B0H11DRAFT_2241763 [Mycena galericulata]|nr:hypothetical protein B0H11DRAFT_2241763 [Mycena galericulata]